MLIEPPTLTDIERARDRIAGVAIRSPLVRLHVEHDAEIWLKLENLQPIGSFKIRGAMNAMRARAPESLRDGVYTASAGNMAQGVAWGARELGIPCTVLVPDHAPATKLAAVARLGARTVKLPFDDWWRVLVDNGHPDVPGTFIHPVADRDVIAGNATIGLEIAEELDADVVIVPYGGGGLSSGIAAALRATSPRTRVIACEVATAAAFRAALDADRPVDVDYTATFVDGIGSRRVLDAMWPMARSLVGASIVVSVDAVERALRLLVERAHVVAEGAGATAVAAAFDVAPTPRRIVCVVSGGNIEPAQLARIVTQPY
jgi:threonine dehydratase